MSEQIMTSTLDAVLDATRKVLDQRLAGMPAERELQAGIDLALKSVRLAATETLGPTVTLFGGTQEEVVEKIVAAWERNA
jgi:hypothetical protein